MPQSIEQLLKESKELIERSRKLRERSQHAIKQFIDVTKCSDSLSDYAKTMRHSDDSGREKLFSK
jgi:hypothetical protein